MRLRRFKGRGELIAEDAEKGIASGGEHPTLNIQLSTSNEDVNGRARVWEERKGGGFARVLR